jgi:hypothetical protein
MGSEVMPSPQSIKRYLLIWVKRLIGWLYLLIGAPGYKSKLIVFVVHEVADQPRAHALLTNTYSTKKNFLNQISLMSSNFQFLDPLSDPLWASKAGCLITFDDGYRGSLEAAKTLGAFGVTSIHLLNLETISGEANSSALLHFSNLSSGNETNWRDSTPKNSKDVLAALSESELKALQNFSGPYLNPAELDELKSLDHVILGDHFLNHWHGDSLADKEVINNLSWRSQHLRELHKIHPYFAAPHGVLNLKKLELVSSQGYEVIFSGTLWRKIGNTTVLPRIDLNNSINSKFSLFGAIAILIVKSKIKTKSLR